MAPKSSGPMQKPAIFCAGPICLRFYFRTPCRMCQNTGGTQQMVVFCRFSLKPNIGHPSGKRKHTHTQPTAPPRQRSFSRRCPTWTATKRRMLLSTPHIYIYIYIHTRHIYTICSINASIHMHIQIGLSTYIYIYTHIDIYIYIYIGKSWRKQISADVRGSHAKKTMLKYYYQLCPHPCFPSIPTCLFA